jgi:hypothetical protein
MNMFFNEEPMGGRDPHIAPWWQRLPDMAQQGAQAVEQGLRAVQQVQDPLTPEEAMRQLRMERARQSYERNFGMRHAGGESLAAQGNQPSVEFLIDRIKRARADGTFPRRA